MSERFDEAPPLPRQPTAISVPEAMGVEQIAADPQPPSALTGEEHSLPPPPKFPSLTDVGLSSATAAAAALQESDNPTRVTQQTTTSPPIPETADDDHTAEPRAMLSASTALSSDIDAAIARDAVAPGTGVKKAIEVGQKLWTDGDQEALNRLLKEGQTVYVPPDVVEDDMLRVRRSHYVPVPVPHGDANIESGVDATPDLRSISTRIEQWNQVQWNQVVSRETENGDRSVAAGAVPVPVPAPVPAPSTLVEDAEGRPLAETGADGAHVGQDEETREAVIPAPVAVPVVAPIQGEGDTREIEEKKEEGEQKEDVEDGGAGEAGVTDRSTEAKKDEPAAGKADVSKSIFGANFLTVPVTSRKEREPSTMGTVDESGVDMEEVTKEVMLKSDSAARINVTEDYGLQDGHANGTNDAAFFSDGSLVTCGNDGKVCIWDMEERVVDSEFMPYDGEAVTMVYPLQNEDQAQTKILVTLSKSRMMRIWTVDKKNAIMLRSTQIKSSEKELYMSIPYISEELKSRATAAAYAAAITTTEPPKIPKPLTPVKESKPEAEEEEAAETAEAQGEEEAGEEEEDEKGSRRFSFAKVLSFGRSSGARKAVAS